MKLKSWPTESLGSQVKFLSGGTPRKQEERYWGGEIPWVSSAEMTEGRIYETSHKVTYDGANNGTRLVPKNTVLVVVRGMSLAKECRVSLTTTRESTFNQDIKALMPLSDVDPRFIFYYLRSQKLALRDAASEAAHGTKKLDMPVLEQWPFPVIPFPIQRKIAAILTAYDDLIETNKRRIALLEKMAEELYREWFVRMRFPGHQNTRFVKGVPEGWPLCPFSELVEMNPRESIHKSDPAPYVGMENLSQTSMHFVSNVLRSGASGSKFRNRDTLLPRITPCLENGKRGFVTCLKENQVGIGSTEFIVFREKVLPAEYIYLLSCNPSFRQHAELSMTGASGRQRVQHDCFDYFFIPKPPEEICNQFEGIVQPLFESVTRFSDQIAVLTKTRDLLLPRLISGKLSVEDLDIRFPPSMQEGGRAQESVIS